MMNPKRIKQLKIALAVVFAVWLIQPALAHRKYDAQHEGVRALKETATSRNNSSHYKIPDYYQYLPGSLTVDLEKTRLRKAVEHGYAEAQYQLGRSYADNRGFVKGEAEAAKWFRKAAYQGHVRAQNRLGLCCQYGKGLEKNDVEATLWHQKAAEQGHSKAQYNLGDCYAKGNGIEKDKAEAVKWYLKAAEQGYAIDTQADGQKQ